MVWVTGQVVWFNARKGYGFNHRDDCNIFVYYTAIVKNNPNKFLRSFAQGEKVQFYSVLGKNIMLEAAKVTGPFVVDFYLFFIKTDLTHKSIKVKLKLAT